MLKYFGAFCIVATLLAVTNCAHDLAPAPSPSQDCSTIIYSNMVDCLPYLMNEELKPDGSCCSGFEFVLETDVHCICEAMDSPVASVLGLNITRAISLPISCAISSSPLTNCAPSFDVSPPMLPPGPSPNNQLSSIATAPSLSVGRNGAHSVSASFAVLLSLSSIYVSALFF